MSRQFVYSTKKSTVTSMDSNDQSNSFLLKSGRLVRPGWNSNNPSVFRLLDGLNESDGCRSFSTCTVQTEDGYDFGTWVQQARAALFAFEEKVSFILNTSPDEEMLTYRNGPYVRLYNAMKKYADGDSAIGYYMKMTDKNNKDRLLPDPAMVTFSPVITYYRNDKEVGLDNLYGLDILMIKRSLFELISNKMNQSWRGPVEEIMDLTDPADGHFLVIWNKSKRTPDGISPEEIMSQQGSFGYNLALPKRHPILHCYYDGMSAAVSQELQDWYASQIRPWKDTIHYMSHEEQMGILNRFAPGQPMLYAFRGTEYESMLTDDVKRRAESEPKLVQEQVYPTASYQQAPVQRAPMPIQQPVINNGFEDLADDFEPIQEEAPAPRLRRSPVGPAPSTVSSVMDSAMSRVDNNGIPF